jgi:hypothetical protein
MCGVLANAKWNAPETDAQVPLATGSHFSAILQFESLSERGLSGAKKSRLRLLLKSGLFHAMIEEIRSGQR